MLTTVHQQSQFSRLNLLLSHASLLEAPQHISVHYPKSFSDPSVELFGAEKGEAEMVKEHRCFPSIFQKLYLDIGVFINLFVYLFLLFDAMATSCSNAV